jgi:N6-L-threonylcarbamoyladenine synthase
VACNSELRAAVRKLAEEAGLPVYLPSPVFTTDNAAMIAAAAYPKLVRGQCSGWDLSADVSLRLQNIDLENPKKRARYRL